MITLLLVEDEESAASLVSSRVGDAQVRWVRSREEAMEHIEGVDAVVLDLGLPDSAGFETLAAFLDAAPHVPIVVLTGSADPHLEMQALEAGAQEYVHKDDTVRLEQRVQAAIIRQRHRNRALGHALNAGVRAAEMIGESMQSQVPASLSAFGMLRLREALPEVFRRWVESYADLVEASAKARTYSTASRPIDRVKSLARDVALVNASPRDLIDVHVEVTGRLGEQHHPERHAALAEEARVVLLELVGYLALYYRDQAPFRVRQDRT